MQHRQYAMTANTFEFLSRHGVALLVHTGKGCNQEFLWRSPPSRGMKAEAMFVEKEPKELLSLDHYLADPERQKKNWWAAIWISGEKAVDLEDELTSYVHELYHVWFYVKHGGYVGQWEYTDHFRQQRATIEEWIEQLTTEFLAEHRQLALRLYRSALRRSPNRLTPSLGLLRQNFHLFPMDFSSQLRWRVFWWQWEQKYFPNKAEVRHLYRVVLEG